MPQYEFECDKCKSKFLEILAMSNAQGKGIKCPACGSKKKRRLLSSFALTFTNPRGTSKADSFSYVAGYNLNQAQEDRRKAEKLSHVGTNPYPMMDDANRYGEGITDLD